MPCQDFTPADLHKLRDIEILGWEGLDTQFKYYLDRSYCLPRKITRGAGLAAVGSAIIYEESAWLGHILVAPDCRRQGLGSRITQDLIDLVERQGIRRIHLIASALGLPLYQQLGFTVSGQHQVFENCGAQSTSPAPAIRNMEHSDRVAVLKLDHWATGDLRESVWRACSEPGWVYTADRGIIRGIYQPDFGQGLVIAEDDEAGIALLQWKHREMQSRAALPVECHAASEFLGCIGTQVDERQIRMTRGHPSESQPSMIYSRGAGFLG